MVEKEPSSAVYYRWDLGNDFVSLTLRLFFCDLWFISVHSSQGSGSPSPSTEECKINASGSFIAFSRHHLVLSLPDHPYSRQPELPASPQMCQAFPCTGRSTLYPFCLGHTFRLYPHGAWWMLNKQRLTCCEMKVLKCLPLPKAPQVMPTVSQGLRSSLVLP